MIKDSEIIIQTLRKHQKNVDVWVFYGRMLAVKMWFGLTISECKITVPPRLRHYVNNRINEIIVMCAFFVQRLSCVLRQKEVKIIQ